MTFRKTTSTETTFKVEETKTDLPSNQPIGINFPTETFATYLRSNASDQKWLTQRGLAKDPSNPQILTFLDNGTKYNLQDPLEVQCLYEQELIKPVFVGLDGRRMANYYAVLGIRRDVGEKERKKAFRKLARTYHPDEYSSESVERKSAAEEIFKVVNEANGVLSDSEKRRKYDQEIAGMDFSQQTAASQSPLAVEVWQLMQQYGIPMRFTEGTRASSYAGMVYDEKTGRWINPRTEEGARMILDVLKSEHPEISKRSSGFQEEKGQTPPTKEESAKKEKVKPEFDERPWEMIVSEMKLPKKMDIQIRRRKVNGRGVVAIRMSPKEGEPVELPFWAEEMDKPRELTRRLEALGYFMQASGFSDRHISAMNGLVGEVIKKHLAGQLRWPS